MPSFILIIFFLFSTPLFAGIPGLESAYSRLLSGTRSRIINQTLVSHTKPQTCNSQILDIIHDNKINILVAFGYMDVSGGQDFNDSNTGIYGNGDVLDIDAAKALAKTLQKSCNGRNHYACGFRKRGNSLSKKIRNRWSGKKNIEARIELYSPAATVNDAANKSNYVSEQQLNTRKVKSRFLSALGTHDVVIYMGHARGGGGPDFAPPVLYASGNVNYNYYRSRREGIRAMLSALGGAKEKASVLGILACKSTGLFANSIRKKSPNSILVTANDLFDYNDILPTGYAMIEAVLSQRCGSEISNLVKVQPKSARFLRVFQ